MHNLPTMFLLVWACFFIHKIDVKIGLSWLLNETICTICSVKHHEQSSPWPVFKAYMGWKAVYFNSVITNKFLGCETGAIGINSILMVQVERQGWVQMWPDQKINNKSHSLWSLDSMALPGTAHTFSSLEVGKGPLLGSTHTITVFTLEPALFSCFPPTTVLRRPLAKVPEAGDSLGRQGHFSTVPRCLVGTGAPFLFSCWL